MVEYFLNLGASPDDEFIVIMHVSEYDNDIRLSPIAFTSNLDILCLLIPKFKYELTLEHIDKDASYPVIELFFQNGVKPTICDLYERNCLIDPDIVNLYLEFGMNINENYSDRYSSYPTILFHPRIKSDEVEILLDLGIDITIKDKRGNTALECRKINHNNFYKVDNNEIIRLLEEAEEILYLQKHP